MPGSTPTVRAVEPVDPSRTAGNRRHTSLQESRAALGARLEARRPEMVQAVLTRLHAISDPSEVRDPDYAEGLLRALSVALDYGLEVIERGEERSPPIPPALLAQARMAARNGVGLDTVVRRYVAGYSLLSEFVIQEAEDGGLLGGAALQCVLRGQGAVLDRLIAAVSEEHGRESNGQVSSLEQRRAERVKRLLDGELLTTGELEYELGGWHLGVVAAGPEAAGTIRDLARTLDRRLLLVRPDEDTIWAWLGCRRRTEAEQVASFVSSDSSNALSLSIGEPAQRIDGWRLTHQQARAAWPIAMRDPRGLVRYSDVALLASILQDDVLLKSVSQLYLSPLSADRDGGAALRLTLRAYFAAERNVSSTASALGVSRQTVVNRLRAVEERLDRPLTSCAAELEAALRVEELGHSPLSYADSTESDS